MASQAQIDANRKNAKKSTGPRTARGKEFVSRNAVKHGFFSRDDVVKDENQADFDRCRLAMLEVMAPTGRFRRSPQQQLCETNPICPIENTRKAHCIKNLRRNTPRLRLSKTNPIKANLMCRQSLAIAPSQRLLRRCAPRNDRWGVFLWDTGREAVQRLAMAVEAYWRSSSRPGGYTQVARCARSLFRLIAKAASRKSVGGIDGTDYHSSTIKICRIARSRLPAEGY